MLPYRTRRAALQSRPFDAGFLPACFASTVRLS